MIKKNLRILLAYVSGIVLSLLLQASLSPLLPYGLIFSVLTAIVTLGLVYTQMWRCGKYDALHQEASPLNALGYMGFYIAITFVVELIIIIFKTTNNLGIPEIIHTVWFSPFVGFYTNKTILVVSLVVALATIALSMLAYYMGVAGVSLTGCILNIRKKRIDKKTEQCFKEIKK